MISSSAPRLLVFTRDTDFYSEQLLRELQRDGLRVAVVVEPHRRQALGERAPDLEQLAGPPLKHRLDRAAIRGYAAHIDAFLPDVCLCYTSRAFSTAVLARRAARHRPRLVGTRGAMGGVSAFNPLDWLTYLNPRVDAVVAFSHAIEARLRQEATRLWSSHPGRFVTIHQAYDSLPGLVAARPAGPAHRPLRLMCVANDRGIKGMEVLLDALDGHVASDDWTLDLVGRMSEATQARVARSSRLARRVALHGFRPDVRQMYARADLYIQPTRLPGEGIGNAIAEAMAAGLPCIVTAAGGATELVVDGENGWWVRPDDAADLGARVSMLIAEPALLSVRGAAAPARLAQEFSLRAEVERYRSLLAALTSG